MDIEYQKKEVTWCLDREGPRICLRAVAINGKLKSLEITCEDFRIEFENDEAKDFLTILDNIITSKSHPKPEYYEEEKEVKVDTVPIPEPPQESASDFEIVEKAPSLDTSEILDVLKQSESTMDEAQAPLLDLLRDQKEIDLGFNEKHTKLDEIPVDKPGIMIEENVKPSEILRENVDTASFFHDEPVEIPEEKSPLEQLLEEDHTPEPLPIPSKETVVTTVHQENIPKRSTVKEKTEIKPFTPDDLSSSAFISDFNAKMVEEIDRTARIDSPQSISTTTDETSEFTDSERQKKYSSTEERRREIEKEREARKKRLWELTRGF